MIEDEVIKLYNKGLTRQEISLKGYKIRSFTNCRGKKNILCNCEGDEVWLPAKHIKLNSDKTILIEDWLLNAKKEQGQL